ncbi:AraC family transcriptional regulator [Gorillibacterium sp. CAU 1737]|uniref:AraC family transcriptional regulator n=1 Tax=Gorillibacterium sp. CAU 1737 TaxID=3140362 RepID=UPI0032605C74
MNKELHESNRYPDMHFPIQMYTVSRWTCTPHGRGFQDLHWHEELQFTLVTSGRITIQINGEDHHLHSGEAIFINKGVLHVTTELPEDGTYVSFNFPESLLCFFPGSRMERDHVQPYMDGFVFPAKILSPNVSWQADLLQGLWHLKQFQDGEKPFGWQYEVACSITRIWLLLIRHVALLNPSGHHKAMVQQQERIQRLLGYIHQHYSESISLADIAKAAAISVAECGRCFTKTVHTTPYKYLMEYRIKRSKDLLSTTGLAVTDIATRVGFNHANHFIQTFKKSQGVTPNEYRKRMKSGNRRGMT